MKLGMNSLDARPQARDQSHKVPTNEARSWLLELSKSSKVWLLHSHQKYKNQFI